MMLFGGLSVLTHIPYFFLPLPTLGDSHMHAGLPALAWARLSAFFYDAAGFDLRYLTLFPAFCLMVLAAVYRERIKRAEYAGKAVAALLFAGVLYVVFVLCYSPFERFGDLEHLLRYPLLGKLVYFAGYSVFGIHEWVGRASQLAMHLAGAVYFSRLLYILSGSRSIHRSGFIIYLLFPPFWNYAHMNYLDAGVLFFACAGVYYLLLYLKENDPRHLMLDVIVVSAAVMYKEYLLALLPICAAIVLCYHIAEQPLKKDRVKALLAGMVFPALLGLQFFLTILYITSTDTYDYNLVSILSPGRLLVSFKNIPAATGFPLFALAAGGLLLSVVKYQAAAIYFSAWFVIFWVLISATLGYPYPRTNLIAYIPAAGFVSMLTGYGAGKLKSLKTEYSLMGLLFVIIASYNMIVGTSETVPLKEVDKHILPYEALFMTIKEEELYEYPVYAPMICEPSHFYMAKHGILKTDFLDRRGWEDRAGSFEEFLAAGEYEYIIMPRGRHTDEIFSRLMKEDLQAALLNGGFEGVELYKSFYDKPFYGFGRNYLYLLKVSP